MSEPIIPGFYPDPTICRVGQDYYLAHSSFEYFPGVPLWHSRDLLHWRQIGHILTRPSQFAWGDGRPSSGIFAGTLRHHDGRFWYATTNASDFNAGQLIVSSNDPLGRWSDPVWVPEAIGIDPDLAWHGGLCYLTWKAMDFQDGDVGILQAPLDLATGQLIAPAYPIWQGSGLDAVEGPHLYRIGDHWYVVLAEGGTERGHAVSVARAPHPAGPYEAYPANPILSHRSTIDPVQSTGHADLVQLDDGQWAAVYLGTRPRGPTPGFHVLGRETFLAGVEWADGWPIIDENRFAAPLVHTAFVDYFDRSGLDHRWVVPGGEPATTVTLDPSNGLTILPRSSAAAGLLCTRVRDLRWQAEVELDGRGEFQLRVDARHRYGLVRSETGVVATARIGGLDVALGEAVAPAGPVILRIEAVDPSQPTVPLGDAGPDEIVLSLVGAHGAVELGRLDGRYLSTEVASGFTGRVLALAATEVPAHIRRVAYRPVTGRTDTTPPELNRHITLRPVMESR